MSVVEALCSNCINIMTPIIYLKGKGEFTSEQIEELRDAFDMFDKDKSGTICGSELIDVMNSLGMGTSEEEVDRLTSEVDADGDGAIDFQEFVAMMVRRRQTRDDKDDIKEAFSVFDQDGDGYLSAQELHHFMTSLGERLTDEEAEDMLQEADTDRDGYISFQDFINVVYKGEK